MKSKNLGKNIRIEEEKWRWKKSTIYAMKLNFYAIKILDLPDFKYAIIYPLGSFFSGNITLQKHLKTTKKDILDQICGTVFS